MISYFIVLVMIASHTTGARQHVGCDQAEANATALNTHFSCVKKNGSYHFSILSPPHEGVFLDMKVTLSKGDTFNLTTTHGNGSKTVLTLSDAHQAYPISYFILAENVTLSAVLHDDPKPADRVFSGTFHSGCNYNMTTRTSVYYLPEYIVSSGTAHCSIMIHAEDSKDHEVYMSMHTLGLKGQSELSISGQNVIFPGNLKAGQLPPYDFISEAGFLQLNLTLDTSVENQTAIVLIESVYKNCSWMRAVESDSRAVIYLPANVPDFLLQRLACRWVVQGQTNNALGLEVLSLSLNSAQGLLVATDGGRRDSPIILQASQGNEEHVSNLVSRTSSKYIWVSLTIPEYYANDAFTANVTVSAQGGHLKEKATNVRISGEESQDSVFLLEVNQTKQVVLSPVVALKSKEASVEVVSDFYRKGPVLQKFVMGSEGYSVASINNRLMLRAQKFTKDDSFTFNFTGVERGCHETTLGTSGSYSLSGNCEAVCTWAINPSDDSGKADKFSLWLDHLDLSGNGSVTISSLTRPSQPLLRLNSSYSSSMPVEMSSVGGAYMVITRSQCAQQNDTVASGSTAGVLGSTFSPKLAPGVGYSFRSPRFPNQYPLNSTRSWTFEGKGIGGFHLTFRSMDIAQGHALILMSGNQSVPLKGSTLPADIVLEKPQMHAQFSAPIQAGYASGYGFDALLTPADGVQVIGKEAGTAETPSFPAFINESRTYLWSIYVPNTDTKKTSVAVRFNISHLHKSAKDTGILTVYDGNSVRSPVLENVTDKNLLSRTDTILVKFVTMAGSDGGSALQLNFTTYRCNMSDTCNNTKICIHEDWRCNGVNDCGDNTDEVGCSYHPTPAPPPTTPSPPMPEGKGGVSTAAFVVTVLLALVIGAAGALFVPVLVRQFRAYRYSRFSNVAVSE